MKPPFAIDLDGVLLDMNSVWIRWISEEYGIHASQSTFTQWDLHQWAGIKHLNKLWKYTWATPLAAYPMAATFLRELWWMGYQPVVVTNRDKPEAIAAAKRDLAILDAGSRGVDLLDHLIFNRGTDKVDTLRKLGAVGFVDDRWELAFSAAEAGISTFLLDKPYNQCLDIESEYTRVHSLIEVIRLLRERGAAYDPRIIAASVRGI